MSWMIKNLRKHFSGSQPLIPAASHSAQPATVQANGHGLKALKIY